MDSGNANTPLPTPWVLLAGIQTGVLGGIAMLFWWGVGSVWYGRSFWAVPNLLATTFYGDSALRWGLHWPTWSGVSLHLILSGVLGMLFGMAFQFVGNRMRVTMLGFTLALAWYFFAFPYLWRTLNPLVPLYSNDRLMLLGHIVFGAALGFYPRLAGRLRESLIR